MSTIQSKNAFDVAKLIHLQPARHLELLDTIDKLRAQGLNEHVALPQLIVCGDQSSGESSVLAAISGVPFPKKDNLCTRFATEVVLRRDDEIPSNNVFVTITPSSTRSPAERSELDSFAREISSMDDLPITIDDATRAMGLGATGSAFSADILRLEVRGPNMPQLTIVDLPGLVHSENKYQSAEDIALVNTLVEEYMIQERSIVPAVVSAKNDYANQIVLTKARKVDPEGKRTLGIITKPDALCPGSAGESSFLVLAQNQDIHFSLGWHVVRNHDSNRPTEQDRDTLELDFFNTSRLSQINEEYRGVRSLRKRLSDVLFHQIQRELPGLISEILTATDDTKSRLARMGRSRATPLEKRMFVIELGQKFHTLCFAACEGLYENQFFEEIGTSQTHRRLRAVVQNANVEFATRMLRAPLQVPPESLGNKEEELDTTVPQRAKTLVQSYRGKELPGTFNPTLVGQLFRELSRPWFDLTREHISNVWLCARATIVAILDEIAEDNVRNVCMNRVVDPELERMQGEMEARLDDYMLVFRRQPITYNHYLTETVQAVRNARNFKAACARCDQLFDNRDRLTRNDVELIASTVVQARETNMDALAAQDLTDYAEAYYKVALKRAIDEIPAHVIEPAILCPLPRILDSSYILSMSEELIDAIGGESDARKAVRESLQAKLDVFSRSSLICKVYAKTTARGALSPRMHMQEEPATNKTPRTAQRDTRSTPSGDEETWSVGDAEPLGTIGEPEPVPYAEPPPPEIHNADEWGTSFFGISSKKKVKKAKAKARFDPQVE